MEKKDKFFGSLCLLVQAKPSSCVFSYVNVRRNDDSTRAREYRRINIFLRHNLTDCVTSHKKKNIISYQKRERELNNLTNRFYEILKRFLGLVCIKVGKDTEVFCDKKN